METGENFIIQFPKDQIPSRNLEVIQIIARDLQTILISEKKLSSIIVRGGGVFDILLGLEPNDIDLFYAFADKSVECKCKELKETINGLQLDYIQKHDIDLENVYEKEPRLEPIERTVGHFSYHTDYNSMFAIDSQGNVWTNKKAFEYFTKNVFEIRYEGILPWAYFPQKTDIVDYFGFQCNVMIKGIAYIIKRNLIPGPDFTEMLSESVYLIRNAVINNTGDKIKSYLLKKIPDKAIALSAIEERNIGDSKKYLINALNLLFSI